MNADIALIMALPNESKGLFEQAGIEVHYSGIGKINAAFKAFEVIKKDGMQNANQFRQCRQFTLRRA